MAILIDGYNLLHATGVLSRTVGPGSVEKLHADFLDFLAARLTTSQIAQTTVVFDAKGRRAQTRRALTYAGFQVHYSARDEDADHLLEELIDAHRDPRHLVVVSSDHFVQRAARRRGAKPVDSGPWWSELLQAWRQRQRAARPDDVKPPAPLSAEEANWWLSQFDDELLEALLEEESGAKRRDPPASASPPPPTGPTRREDPDSERSLDQPFPRAYLEEIERELMAELDRETRRKRP